MDEIQKLLPCELWKAWFQFSCLLNKQNNPLSTHTSSLLHTREPQQAVFPWHADMRYAWITLFVLCYEVRGFLIHNTHHGLCLEDRRAGPGGGAVRLRECNPDSPLQQWIWRNRRVLQNLGSDGCLAGRDAGRVRTVGCRAPEEEEEGAGGGGGEGGAAVAVQEEILWDCEGGRLISVSGALELSVDGGLSPALSLRSKRSGKWRSLDEGDICQESLRSKRASKEPDELEKPVDGMDPRAGMAGMTEEQKRFLLWYYRTEDPTTWKFVMLGLSFFCLLVGFLLLGMGSMANKSRRKIAKYKAVAAASARRPGGEEQLTLTESLVPGYSDLEASQGHGPPPPSAKGGDGLSPGEILVTWKDGNISTLNPAPWPEEEEEEEEKEEEEKKEEEEEKEEYTGHTPDREESRRDESVVEVEEEKRDVCSEEGVQQIINGKIE